MTEWKAKVEATVTPTQMQMRKRDPIAPGVRNSALNHTVSPPSSPLNRCINAAMWLMVPIYIYNNIIINSDVL